VLVLGFSGNVFAADPETEVFDEDYAEDYSIAHDSNHDEISMPDVPNADIRTMNYCWYKMKL
jgi:hypothetical protein